MDHKPVMVREVVELLTGGARRGGLIVDATLGGGGHAEALLETWNAKSAGGRTGAACPPLAGTQGGPVCVVGVDQDADALEGAVARLERFGDRFRAVRGNFRNLAGLLDGELVDGVVMDLGVSSHQLETADRGFSFQRDGPLDMRMDRGSGLTAEEIVNRWPEEELERIFREFGEERQARRVARRLVERRVVAPLRRTLELADLVARVVRTGGRIHPATRVFQALRMAVNDEPGALSEGLSGAWGRLHHGGRLAVISFHSLEDRIVKNQFLRWEREERTGRRLTRKPLTATAEEVRDNPRARSAKLRAAEKLEISESKF